jgi:hypothetical protein
MGSSPAPGLFDDVRPNGRNRRNPAVDREVGEGLLAPHSAVHPGRPECRVYGPLRPFATPEHRVMYDNCRPAL